MSSYDKSSRLKTSLRTTDKHYDEVVAFSQTVINKSWENLLVLYPILTTLDWEEEEIGSLKGTLIAPRVIIPGNIGLNLAKLTYQMRFDTCTLTLAKNGKSVKLDNWILAVTIDLDDQNLGDEPDPDKDPDEYDKWKRQKDFIENHFDIPGDYTVERLYAKLSDAWWDDFDFENSTFYDDNGKKCSWTQWKKDHKDFKSALPALLREWAQDQEDNGYTTLGVKCILPPETEIDPQKPTYAPTSAIHQIYPYKDDQGKVTTSDTGNGNYNCFLYCEMVTGNPLPQSLQLGYSGNFCYPPSNATASDNVDGTFVLSHELLMQRFFLPRFEPFNVLSEIHVKPTVYDSDSSILYFWWKYLEGKDPDDDPKRDFSFTVDNADKPTCYTFSSTNSNPGNLYKSCDPPRYARSSATSSTDVTVKWEPGTNQVDLSGETKYDYDLNVSDKSDLSSPWAWYRFTCQLSWSFKVMLATDTDGTLNFTLEDEPASSQPAHYDVRLIRFDQRNTQDPDDDLGRMKTTLAGGLRDQLKALEANLTQAFKRSGRFIYPGNGQLDFSNPIFNDNGDVIAAASYKPLQPGDKFKVPDAPKSDYAPIPDVPSLLLSQKMSLGLS